MSSSDHVLVNRPWKPEEDEILKKAVEKFGAGKWALISTYVPGRSNHQCRQRWSVYLDPSINREPLNAEECRVLINLQARIGTQWVEIAKHLPGRTYGFLCDHWYNSIRRKIVKYLSEKQGVDRIQIQSDKNGVFDYREGELEGAIDFVLASSKETKAKHHRWTPEEDETLQHYVQKYGCDWVKVASKVPGRTNRQCRERYVNYLDPSINKNPLSENEYKIIIEQHAKLGNKWTEITRCLKGRTDEYIKTNWSNLIRRKIAKYLTETRGIDKSNIQCDKNGAFIYRNQQELDGAVAYVLRGVSHARDRKRMRSASSNDDAFLARVDASNEMLKLMGTSTDEDTDRFSALSSQEIPDTDLDRKPSPVYMTPKQQTPKPPPTPKPPNHSTPTTDSTPETSRKRVNKLWKPREDLLLKKAVETHGTEDWVKIAADVPGRSNTQCLHRWKFHLDPNISKGSMSEQEYRVLLEAQSRLGNKWAEIQQTLLPNRTAYDISNIWNSSVCRRVVEYLAQIRLIPESQVEFRSDGRILYQDNDEMEGALAFVVESMRVAKPGKKRKKAPPKLPEFAARTHGAGQEGKDDSDEPNIVTPNLKRKTNPRGKLGSLDRLPWINDDPND